jgi:hypothetical protein
MSSGSRPDARSEYCGRCPGGSATGVHCAERSVGSDVYGTVIKVVAVVNQEMKGRKEMGVCVGGLK